MDLTAIQNEVAADTHRFRVLRIGRRGGKTTLAVVEMKGFAVAKPSKICYIGPTYQQARDIAWEMLKKELGKLIISANEARLEMRTHTIRAGESLIVLRGWESIENLRGQAFDFIVVDEVAMVRNFWALWQEVIRPTLTDTKGQALFCSTPKGFNHFYKLSNLELTDQDFKSFHFTTYDNPVIPREEIETAKNQLTPERFAQEYLADFRKTEGLVYKEFNREKHLYDELPDKELDKIAGVDFGYVNPAAVLDIRTNGDEFYVEDEWYKTKRTDKQIAEYVASNDFREVYPDPESPGAIEEMKQLGVNVREVIKGKDSVQSGIQKVRELFTAGKLHIHKRCENLIFELETYSYEDATDRNQKEKPIKANDHALDALRYPVMMKIQLDASLIPSMREVEYDRREAKIDYGF